MEAKKPYLVVIIIQIIYAVMFMLSKAAFDGGMNTFIFVFYRQALATVFLAPLAFFFEWKSAPPLSFVTFIKIFMLSLFGITLSLDLNGVALEYTSATLAAAATNSLPAITFFLALLLGMETLRLKSVRGMAKLVGIVVCMGGVVTLALYKGPHMKLPFCHHWHGLIIHHHHDHHYHHQQSNGVSWIKGCFLMITSNTLFGLWIVLQVRVMKAYPSRLFFTTLQCFLSSIQSFFIAIALERDTLAWKLGWNLRLLAVVYCGFIVTGVSFYMQSWVIEKKGPVFLAMSSPLALLFTLICSAFLLCEIITLASVVGGLLLIVGLYCVLWGKSREEMNGGDEKIICSSRKEVEILCSNIKVVVG